MIINFNCPIDDANSVHPTAYSPPSVLLPKKLV